MKKVLLRATAGLFVAFLIIGVIAAKDDNADFSNSTTVAVTSSAPRPPSVQERIRAMMPGDQASLIAAVETARQQYASGANEMAQGAARPARAQAICKALHSRSVDGWIGRVTELSTNGEGKGVLSIKIGPDVSVKTWNNSLSDIGDNTLIEPSSPLFSAATQLRVGQLVTFGGTLFENKMDCVRESSLTLAGSIREPEFIFRFRSVSAVD
jgi:hypothetical protein